jgi:hypothetical protein
MSYVTWYNEIYIESTCLLFCFDVSDLTLFAQALVHSKNICPSSSLLQGKHLPFTTSPLHLNICCLFVILSLTNYIVTLPRYFSFRLPHLIINTGPPSGEMDKNIQRKSHFLFFSHWNGYSHFRSVLIWFRN